MMSAYIKLIKDNTVLLYTARPIPFWDCYAYLQNASPLAGRDARGGAFV